MENHFFILSRLGFILNGFCSPLNVFLSYYYFLFLAPWPWLLGPRPPPQALPGSPRASPWPLWVACPAGCENECANLVKKKRKKQKKLVLLHAGPELPKKDEQTKLLNNIVFKKT